MNRLLALVLAFAAGIFVGEIFSPEYRSTWDLAWIVTCLLGSIVMVFYPDEEE